jgi:hypothetical protein
MLKDLAHCHNTDCDREPKQNLMKMEEFSHVRFCSFVQRYIKKEDIRYCLSNLLLKGNMNGVMRFWVLIVVCIVDVAVCSFLAM